MFSNEVLQLFVDELSDDRKALLAVATVSHVFNDAARRHLFHAITLSSRSTLVEARAHVFIPMLPKVVKYIRVVHVHLRHPPESQVKRVLLELAQDGLIHTIDLTGIYPLKVSKPLLDFLHTPSVTQIHLSNIADISSKALLDHPGLRRLCVNQVTFEPGSPLCAVIPSVGEIEFEDTLVRENGLPPITQVTMELRSRECLKGLAALLALSVSSLRNLCLYVLSRFTFRTPTILFGAFPKSELSFTSEVAFISVYIAEKSLF